MFNLGPSDDILRRYLSQAAPSMQQGGTSPFGGMGGDSPIVDVGAGAKFPGMPPVNTGSIPPPRMPQSVNTPPPPMMAGPSPNFMPPQDYTGGIKPMPETPRPGFGNMTPPTGGGNMGGREGIMKKFAGMTRRN